eukprot:TRINITY_DN6094_c0_g1_i1.p1 TRINITY_DN6094_c0_g1~~TRINITY_DN6094_c0_g1_i1.p1  ORF type:complete len:196 (+),score=59.46 TRINITY_DN6094_c0_g1_i1:90-677(+)
MAIISVLVGTVRVGRQGIKVAKAVAKSLASRGHEVQLIDPLEQFPSLVAFRGRYSALPSPPADLAEARKLLVRSDAFIAVTPEYNFSYSAAMKSIIDTYLDEWKFKPFGIVSYSMGTYAGVRAIQEMRGLISSVGGVPAATLPIPLVQNNVDEDGQLKQESLVTSMDTMLNTLEWYSTALANHRKADPSILPKLE